MGRKTYLCDIFNLLNTLNLLLQGTTKTVFKLADKVAAFKVKLELWGQRVNIGIFDMFQTLSEILKDWASAFFLPTGVWSPISFQKSVSITSQPQKTLNWEAMDPWPICE